MSVATTTEREAGRLRRAVAAVRRRAPIVHGTQCPACHYEVPALGLTPDSEMAWFERFEGRPCPQCTGVAVGVLAGVAVVVLRRRLA